MSTKNCPNAGQTELAAESAPDGESSETALSNHQIAPCAPTDPPRARAKRKRRRDKSDRGLPPDQELAKLAVAYLDRQRKHWPKLCEAGYLPEPTAEIVGPMVADFKERHRTGNFDVESVRPFLKFCSKLAGSYNRYSCDNSSPTSAADQMVNGLDKAKDDGRFVPWAYVFADYSVTGLDPSRQGYSSYKEILAHKEHLIETTYIDDFTRASRDELEWWKLASLSKRLNKRMIGSSDGFDLHSPDWDMKITIYGLLSRLFIKSLQQKVKRGMRGAARRGTSVGKPSLGFTRCVQRTPEGNAVVDSDGQPIYKPCFDPETREHRLLLYELFVDKSWSAYRITQHFNKMKVDDWNGWTSSAILDLLRSSASIGVFIWNRTRREYDWESGKWIKVRNPRSEWEVYYDPTLAIVPMELWRGARRKLAAMRRDSPLTGRKPSRNQVSASTLFSGTLFCEYCGNELTLCRSSGKYKIMYCCNGATGAHGCQLSASKSIRIIEDSLLGHLRDVILTESRIQELVAKANIVMEQEARKPQTKTAPLKTEGRKLEAKISKLVRVTEDEPNEELCAGYNKRIKELQRELNRLLQQIRDAEMENRKPTRPLTLDRALVYLGDFRKTLNQEIPMAAEAIRMLTGPIKIRQEPLPGRKRGARWIATFSPDLARVLRFAAMLNSDKSALPSADELQAVEVPIEKIPKYEKLAPIFKQMHDNGTSIASIASAHGMCWQYAAEIIHFADTGERPKWKWDKGSGGARKPTIYPKIAKKVANLRDKKQMPFQLIATKLGVAHSTVVRAYDHARPEAVRQAVEGGAAVERGQCSGLGEATHQKIRELLNAGKKAKEIAAKVGCGTSTVYREKQKMKHGGDGSVA